MNAYPDAYDGYASPENTFKLLSSSMALNSDALSKISLSSKRSDSVRLNSVNLL